jgi:hypothetical protein
MRRSFRKEKRMASIEKFNDHCWRDVVPAADLELYKFWRRETFVGPRPALLAIDLYDLVYRGGPRPPAESNDQFPTPAGSSHIARLADQAVAAARGAASIFFAPGNLPEYRRAARYRPRTRPTPPPDAFEIYREFRSNRTTS